MDNEPEILEVKVDDKINAKESTGDGRSINKGIAATFHLTSLQDYDKLILAAWRISGDLGLPAVIVVRAPRKV